MAEILTNALIVTMNDERDVMENAAVVIEGDRIVAVGPTEEISRDYADAEQTDCAGSIIIPGMVNTHTHSFQTLLKGLGDDMELKKWFSCMTGPAALQLTQDDLHIAAMHACVESIRSGVTTLVDFQYVHTRPDMSDKVVQAFQVSGMRGFVCRGFMTTGTEFGVPDEMIEQIDDVVADVRASVRKYNRPGGRVQIGIAPCMVWTVDRDAYIKVRALADEEGLLITMHLSETDFEIERAAADYGCTDTKMLHDIGFWGPDVLAVHCVNCNHDDIEILKQSDTKVSHNPCSNLYLGSGIAPIPEMLALGITVALGSDGPASSNNHSIFQAMKFAALIQKGVRRDPTIMTAEKVLAMATIEGARSVGLDHEIGSIEVGKKADLVVITPDNPWMTPLHNVPSALVYSALGHEVSSVMIDGNFVMKHGAVLSCDETEVRNKAQTAASNLAARAAIT
ncbi:MAG: 5-methylthioadenosine/S-adenosylhomocysteine deaminase [Candidatus Azotimanducaceae bacterium]|jgi:5-methylthioadenosine/S-adenosylhomocysteine deaminase